MPEIVPRWEWRTFDAGDEGFSSLAPEHEEASDEVYLLSSGSDASVKIRAGLMDVKELQEARDGLEQWKPVLKASEPISAADLRTVFAALGLDAPVLARDAYSFDELVTELVDPSEELQAVHVHKQRAHYTVAGAMAELSEVTTDRGSRRTIAVESTDPRLVHTAVRELGLDGRPNVNLPRGLKALEGFDARRFAVIDVGTNSVKFHVGERAADGTWTTVVDRSDVTRLGEGLGENGELGAAPIARTVEAIAGMVDEANRDGVEGIAAVGTAGLRIAPNRDDFLRAVRERTGVEVEVIPGDEEARLAYVAATSGIASGGGRLAVFDSGGGSSQFTFGDPGHIEEQFSVNVGAVSVTERFRLDGPVGADAIAASLEAVAAGLERLEGRAAPDLLVGMGGTVTNLAAVKHGLAAYDPAVVQGTQLDRREIDRQIELYRTKTADERRAIPGLQPKRAEVILGGACVVRTVLTLLHCDRVTVSDRGLRHRLIVERFPR